MKHLTHEELSAHLDGALSGVARERVEAHLLECEACRGEWAALSAQDGALGTALDHDPGEVYFETFAARVEDRLRAAGLRGAQARLPEGRLLGWLRSPRRLAMAGAVVAVIGGAAIVVVTARLERPGSTLAPTSPALERSLAQRPTQVPPAGSASGDRSAETGREPAADHLADGSGVAVRDRDERAPAMPAEEGEAVAREDAQVRGKEAAPAPAAPMARPAAPGRLQASRRTASGEDVPVSPSAYSFAAPPPGGAADSKAGLPLAPGSPEQKTSGLPRRAVPAGQRKAQVESAQESRESAAGPRICGRVTDPNGRPVAGARVAIADLGLTTATDAEGGFCIAAPAGLHSLAVMAVGYRESRLDVRVFEETSETLVTLRPVAVLDRGLGAFAKRAGDRVSALSGGEAGARAPFAALPESLRVRVADARRLGDRARTSGAAADFDAAATSWERATAGLSGEAAQEVRFRLAEARFRAWEAGANEARAKAASGALIAYLRHAESGERRDQAAAWLARVLR